MSSKKRPAVFVPKRKLAMLRFSGTELEGLEVQVNLSVPYGLIEAAAEEDVSTVIKLMPTLIEAWNLGDQQGVPLPVTAEGMRRAGIDVVMTIFATAMDQLKVGGLSKNAERPSDSS